MGNQKDHQIKQGAVIGGWICFALGTGVMHLSLWAFYFYIPLLLVAFILSVVALSQRRIIGGLLLLLITLIVPPIQWLCTTAVRTKEFVESNLPPEQHAVSEQGRSEVKSLLKDQSVETKDSGTKASEASQPLKPSQKMTKDSEASSQPASITPGAGPRFTAVEGDTAPIVFEINSSSPTPRDVIAAYVLGFGYRDADEFTKREFIQKLNALIKEKKQKARPEDLYSVTERVHLGEYDFNKGAFPIAKNQETPDDSPVRVLDVPKQANGSSHVSTTDYGIVIPSSIDFVPVELNHAKTFGPALRKSRRALVTYIGTLGKCLEVGDAEGAQSGRSIRLIALNVSEVSMTLEEGGQSVSFAVESRPNTSVPNKTAMLPAKASPPPMVARPAETPAIPEPSVPKATAVSSDDEKSAKDPVQLFFERHFDMISRKDIEGVISDYADQVAYFGSTVGKDHIRKDEIGDFQKWRDIRQIVTKIEKSPSEAFVFRVFTINMMEGDGKSVRKEVENTFQLIPIGNTFQIKAQAAKVLASEEK